MNESDGKLINEAVKDLKNISESILIIQKHENAMHYDTAILKLSSIIKDTKNILIYLYSKKL